MQLVLTPANIGRFLHLLPGCASKRARRKSDEEVCIGIRTVPMGWLGALELVQATARRIGYEWTKLPTESEVRRDVSVPSGDLSFVNLDRALLSRVVMHDMSTVGTFPKNKNIREIPPKSAKTTSKKFCPGAIR